MARLAISAALEGRTLSLLRIRSHRRHRTYPSMRAETTTNRARVDDDRLVQRLLDERVGDLFVGHAEDLFADVLVVLAEERRG